MCALWQVSGRKFDVAALNHAVGTSLACLFIVATRSADDIILILT